VSDSGDGSKARKSTFRILKWAGGLAGILGAVVVAFLYFIGVIGENFREIEAGRCYRSAQLSTTALEKHIKDQHIGCVVNLRGACKEDWYEKEISLCAQDNVVHADFKFDPVRLPRPEVLHDLLERFKTGPYPILMHCRNGVDRTGLAAVLYNVVANRMSLADSLGAQLSWRYGHFRTSKNDAAERFFTLYRDNQHGQSVEEWIDATYPAIYKSIGPYGDANSNHTPQAE
jgi:hypothetical protein